MDSFIKLVKDPAHDCFYSVDRSMIISYVDDDIPGWRAYADCMSRKGKRFFVTNDVRRELGSDLPSPFHLLNDPDGEYRAERALSELLSVFGIPEGSVSAQEFSCDLKWLLQSGYSLTGCRDIPTIDLVSDRVFAITANTRFVGLFLCNPERLRIFEKVVDDRALEHLADIRTVNPADGTFIDRSAF